MLSIVCAFGEYWVGYSPEVNTWYDGGATAIACMLLGDVLLINCVVEGLNVNAQIQRAWAFLTSPTQPILDARCKVSNPSYMAFRYQHILKSWFVALTFGSALPILFLLHALMMISSIVVDRVNLLTRLQPVPAADAVTARFAATIVLPVCIVVHIILGFGAYAVAVARDRGWSAAGYASRDIAHGAFNVTSALSGGGTPGPSMTPPSAPAAEDMSAGVLFGHFLSVRPMVYLAFCALAVFLLLREHFHQQAKSRKLRLLTPLELLRYAWHVDYDGFRLATNGAPEMGESEGKEVVRMPDSAMPPAPGEPGYAEKAGMDSSWHGQAGGASYGGGGGDTEWYVPEPWERLRSLSTIEVVRARAWAPRGGLRSRLTGATNGFLTARAAHRRATLRLEARAHDAAQRLEGARDAAGRFLSRAQSRSQFIKAGPAGSLTPLGAPGSSTPEEGGVSGSPTNSDAGDARTPSPLAKLPETGQALPPPASATAWLGRNWRTIAAPAPDDAMEA